MRRVVCPLVINLFYSCGGDPDDAYLYGTDPKPVDERTPTVRHIHLSGVTATDFRGAAAFICGLPERPVEGVTFSDLRMTADPEEVEGGYPACFWGMDNMIGRGFICTHLADAVFRNVHVSALDGPALSFDSVSDVDVLDLRTAVDDPQVPASLLDFVMYHELLHKKHGVTMVNGRRLVHTPGFHTDERQFPGYNSAKDRLDGLAMRHRA